MTSITKNAVIKKVDNELEDLLYKDAKSNQKLKDVYSAFMKLREGYITCQKNIIEVSIQKFKLSDLNNQVYDYKGKIKNYDIKQLQEQIELLKQANKGFLVRKADGSISKSLINQNLAGLNYV